ncbi:hypothetical protein [Sporolituus thermophilus]|uniref:P-type conjugative transfer protein TrbJ n=1 Tax=Sporolituus thermophilus DSM 23256 TaxID=1123285 RepID=A0A1G7MH65_9FIRM|nr:hypothetical protein [Sporolituus thermophilus]SDF61172.1 P-type conjugative transfer protein TrbJ [Sporolituus thermophilus DSM 23256]
MFKKIFSIFSIFFLILAAAPPRPAEALVVYDPTAVAKLVQQIAIQNQQLQAELAQLANMDAAASAYGQAAVQQALAQLAENFATMQSLVAGYADFQAAWAQVYPDFAAWSGYSPDQYSTAAQAVLAQTNAAIYDAMRAQQLIGAQLPSTSAALQTLMAASATAPGALAAAQAGNQIAALMAQQMMALGQIMSQANQMQAAWYQQQLQERAAAAAAAAQWFDLSRAVENEQSRPLSQPHQLR